MSTKANKQNVNIARYTYTNTNFSEGDWPSGLGYQIMANKYQAKSVNKSLERRKLLGVRGKSCDLNVRRP